MEGTSWNARTWLRKLAWYLHDDSQDISFEHALYPEPQFREELAKEQLRAERSGKALLLMLIDSEPIIGVAPKKEIVASVGEEVTNCVRETDICGKIKEGVLVGVILTEIEPEKIDAAQLAVAAKVRKKLRALLGEEMANRVPITFSLASAGSEEALPSFREAAERPGPRGAGSRLTIAGEADHGGFRRPYPSVHRRG